jgi:hypothetical protein
MFWRFLVADDDSVDRFIVRDADSRLNAREAAAVLEWVQSGSSCHIMRDHPNHVQIMNGGMWGGTKGMLRVPSGFDLLQLPKTILHGEIVPLDSADSSNAMEEFGPGQVFPTTTESAEAREERARAKRHAHRHNLKVKAQLQRSDDKNGHSGTEKKTMLQMVLAWSDQSNYRADINFLEQEIWPLVSHSSRHLAHDAYHCVGEKAPTNYNVRPFPTKRPKNYQHVGQVFEFTGAGGIEEPRMKDIKNYMMGKRNVAPFECRGRPEWERG